MQELSKRIYRVEDIQDLYGVGKSKAYQIIKSIRMTCGGGKLGRGCVLPTEIEHWEKTIKTNIVRRL